MTREELVEILEDTGLEITYRAFPIGEAPDLPYLIYFYEGNDDVLADNQNYVDVKNLVVELYTSQERDFDTEDTVDGVFKTNHMTYAKTEEYIETTSMYRITYEMEVILNGE